MADPVVKKITDLIAADSVAADDLIMIVDMSEPIPANKTKKVNASLLTSYDPSLAQSLIYIQLFSVTELVITVNAKAYFWVPAYLAGKFIKKMGMGLVTAGTSNTTVALGTLANVVGNGFVESGALNVALPSVGTKIPINITAGTGTPKGLDCWFVTGA